MDITLRRDNINSKIILIVEGKECTYYAASRKLTGTTNEGLEGIFSESNFVDFYFGKYKRRFRFDDGINLHTDSLAELQQAIQHRARIVREWVQSIPTVEEITFAV